MIYTNIDYAIATVQERGHELTVPNVLAAYIHCFAKHVSPEDAADKDAISQAAIVSFERAMDKYPVPSPPPALFPSNAVVAKTKGVPQQYPNSEVARIPPDRGLGKRMFCTEVAQLRNEYQRAMWRVPDGDPNHGRCTCLSCGCLLRVRSDQLRKLEPEEEAAVAPKRRTQKVKKRSAKKVRAAKSIPLDPYAPSTSRAAM
ncbi:hypothetical protein BD413DRAFT_602837 [Trametes elegans]|nr:hypothetical protein BD413DRAFT_602837 [Trametes elegans]